MSEHAPLPPAIVVHGLEHIRLALVPARPVTLLSAPAAALYAGCLWWRALIAAADAPDGTPDVLDCADAPGRALEALAVGCRRLVLLPCRAWQNVAARAGEATLLQARPKALDLADPGAPRRIAAWLQVG